MYNGCAKIKTDFGYARTEKITPIVYSIIDGVERASWLEGKENDGVKNYLTSRAGDSRLRPTKNYKDLFLGNIFLMSIIGNKDEILPLEPLMQNNPHIGYHLTVDIYNKEEYWLEVGRADSTKEQGIGKLKKFCDTNKLITFGDNLNDLSMFSISDECYAVANAHKTLKQKATGIIASNNDDGVTLWLEKNADC